MPSGDLHPMTDALSPSEVAFLVETQGVAKATAPVLLTFVLGVVAGLVYWFVYVRPTPGPEPRFDAVRRS